MLREQGKPDTVIQLVCARVIEVFSLDENRSSLQLLRQILQQMHRRWSPLEVLANVAEFVLECARRGDLTVCACELREVGFQFGWVVNPSESSVVPRVVRVRM
jgi:hypothetical protein